jgi:transposase
LFRWIAAFKEKGCAGFDAAPGRGRPARITEDHIPKIKEIVEKEGAILTSQKLKIKLQEEFDVNVSKNTAYKYLKKLDYVYITPRPRHHKKDDSLQVGAIKKYKGRN